VDRSIISRKCVRFTILPLIVPVDDMLNYTILPLIMNRSFGEKAMKGKGHGERPVEAGIQIRQDKSRSNAYDR
jgi:hypothetical protein